MRSAGLHVTREGALIHSSSAWNIRRQGTYGGRFYLACPNLRGVPMRKRLSYANVTATLALVFAMSGGAMAANHYLITSTKQINPKVLKKLTGKAGKTGATGATGAAGATGATGPQGKEGSKGEKGEPGKEGAPNPNAVFATNAGHATNSDELGGVGASHYVRPGSTLTSGDTESGVYGAGAGEGQVAVASITFVPKLAAAPTKTEYVPSGTTSNCPGPDQAVAGYLCVYGGWNYNVTENCIGGLSTACSSSPTVDGAEMFFISTAKEGNTTGTWAYKAP